MQEQTLSLQKQWYSPILRAQSRIVGAIMQALETGLRCLQALALPQVREE